MYKLLIQITGCGLKEDPDPIRDFSGKSGSSQQKGKVRKDFQQVPS
jgi:hypothetical protein